MNIMTRKFLNSEIQQSIFFPVVEINQINFPVYQCKKIISNGRSRKFPPNSQLLSKHFSSHFSLLNMI
ncbi:hypothetical protein BpHYR1_031151 [Brachionus plicatilis]|uniref:Uncharacterized protein n=1 Tax=Brachionus plicatilis TaxID=10195 RepID=A0A3M7SDJ0_BRAPC|nr:hypothetical protein BpHYR1_031151 [Brachionus plicatilis]